jgi:H+-transporting ATPase
MQSTQIVATLIAIYGLFMTPLGWGWARFVRGYALLWFLLKDRVKLLIYGIFDPVKKEPKADSKPETRAKDKPKANDQLKP